MNAFVTYARRCFALLSPADRLRWLRLIPLAILTSAIEAVGTVAIFVLVASLTEPEAVLAMPIIGPLLASLVGGDPSDLAVILVVLVAAFYIAKSLVIAVAEYAQAVAAARTASNLSVRLLTGYLRAPYLFHAARNSSDLVHTATVVAGANFAGVMSAVLHCATELLVFVGILGVLLVAAPGMTLAASLVLLVVGGVLMMAMRRSSARLGEQAYRLGALSMRQQAQALSAVDEITVLGRTKFFTDRFAALSADQAEVTAMSRFLSSVPRITVETLFICGALLASVGMMWSGASSGRTVSLLGLFAYAGFRIIPSANRMLMHVHTIRHGQAGVDRIRADLDEVETDSPVLGTGSGGWDFVDRVVFRSVSLTYPDQPRAVLTDVDFSIQRGEALAIVGSTGSGKSSLIRMLVGLMRPTHGEISVDGVALDDVLGSWRGRLGYIPQEVHLVEDSLRRNIAFGLADEEIDDAAVSEAIGRAQLSNFVAALPDGLDSPVGDRGVRLSGGERQRVGIARALYRRPHVLVLDEATSSLDAQTEAEVLSELRSELEAWTLIAVTHRLASVRGFDRIVFIEGGRIRATGTFDTLAEEVEEFRRIARAGSV